MIKSIKFDEMRQVREIEFVDGVTANQALEVMYQLGIKPRPAVGLVNVRSTPDHPDDKVMYTYEVGTDDVN